MSEWKMDERPEVISEVATAPSKVRRKYGIWKATVITSGPFLGGSGWRTEKLSGNLKKFYSARLDRKWRVIFELDGKNRSIAILSVMPHLYEKIKR
jgi:Txe/YoeB family toxin of Txe-Axe toxin-antitoxin module